MAATESNMMPLGSRAPNFNLPDTISGKNKSLQELKSDRATVVMFICNHCPYVRHVQQGLVRLANDYIPRGISFVAISSNDVENYPEDSPEQMKEIAKHFWLLTKKPVSEMPVCRIFLLLLNKVLSQNFAMRSMTRDQVNLFAMLSSI